VATIDWALLRERAHEAMQLAYVPYSKFRVGAAGLVDDGRIVTSCNVENASYGFTLCAECGMISELARTVGGWRSAVGSSPSARSATMPLSPCAVGAASCCGNTAAPRCWWRLTEFRDR